MKSPLHLLKRTINFCLVCVCVLTIQNGFSQTVLNVNTYDGTSAVINTSSTGVPVTCGNNMLQVNYTPNIINHIYYDIYYSFTVATATTSTIFLSNATVLPAYEYIQSVEIASLSFLETLSPEATTHTTASVAFVPGTYVIKVRYHHLQAEATTSYYAINFNCIFAAPPCEDCIGSFSPNTDKKYMISAWAKQDLAAPTITTYTTPKLTVLSTTGASYSASFLPSGPIIDGWQKIDGEFTLPAAATNINIKLECTAGDCFFDDIRVFPFDGSMKSYVYDPVTLRLVAELDERNYATLYEYDEEGKLVRVKKETERGIMTIKESRNNTSK